MNLHMNVKAEMFAQKIGVRNTRKFRKRLSGHSYYNSPEGRLLEAIFGKHKIH